jgi:hypothetical protein
MVTVVSATATLASPYLMNHAPLLLMCMSPRVAFLGIAAQGTPLLPFVLLGAARLGLTDPLHYLIGRGVGRTDEVHPATPRPSKGLAFVGRLASLVPRPIRLAARPACYLAVLVRPNGVNLLWAGAQRLPPARIALLDVLGTVSYLIVVHAGASALAG